MFVPADNFKKYIIGDLIDISKILVGISIYKGEEHMCLSNMRITINKHFSNSVKFRANIDPLLDSIEHKMYKYLDDGEFTTDSIVYNHHNYVEFYDYTFYIAETRYRYYIDYVISNY